MAIVDPHWPRADVWLAREDDDPRLLVVGVPSSTASLSPSGVDLAPLEMRNRLHRYSTFHGDTGTDFGELTVRDLGNWPVSGLSKEDMIPAVRQLASRLPDIELVTYLGGDNAITRPLVAALGDDLERVGIITFDAHHDVRSLTNGPTNGTPIRGLIEEHGLPGANVVQIGIHSFANSAEYRAYCDEQGIEVVTVSQVEESGMSRVIADAVGSLDACETIYVDVDIDVLDASLVPGCPGARPGGMTIRQLSEGVRLLAGEPRARAMDFVEVDPAADPTFQTVDVMAHLFLEAATGLAART